MADTITTETIKEDHDGFDIRVPKDSENDVLLKIQKPKEKEDKVAKFLSYKIDLVHSLNFIQIDQTRYTPVSKLLDLLWNHGLSKYIPLKVRLDGQTKVLNVDWQPEGYMGPTVWYFEWLISGKPIKCSFTGSKNNLSIYIRIHTLDREVGNIVMQQIREELVKTWEPQVQPTGQIFEWSTRHLQYVESPLNCPTVFKKDLIGLDDHFKCVEDDINILIEKEELCKKLGADSGFNYLLEGPPGTGKSSFVKAVSHQLGLPIYVVKSSSLFKPDTISNVLCPQNIQNGRAGGYNPYGQHNKQTEIEKFRIVLVEDFDRFLDSELGDEVMSELLNALDGIYPSFGTFRFFSANHPERVGKNDAMFSRMRRILSFGLPPENDVYAHLLKLFPKDESDIKQFCHIIKDDKLSMRTINSYICRFIIDDNPIRLAIKGYGEWIKELSIITDS